MKICTCGEPILGEGEFCDICRKERMNKPEGFFCAFCGKAHDNIDSEFCGKQCADNDTKLP